MFRSLITPLALLLIIGSVGFFACNDDDDSGSEPTLSPACETPLAPLGQSEISSQGFEGEVAGLTRVISAASSGDLQVAEIAFFGDVHDFLHDIDGPLRSVDEKLARQLCDAGVSLERGFAFGRVDQVASAATHVRDLVRDAGEALGFGSE